MTALTWKLKLDWQPRPVLTAADRATRRSLVRIGAFLRTRARRKIRPRRRSAESGQPPSAHSRPGLRDIRFALGESGQTVLVGPRRFRSSFLGAPIVRGTGAQLMEFGGTAGQRQEQTRRGNWIGMGKRRRKGRRQRVRNVRYDPHPFMGPSLDEEVAAGTIPPTWTLGPAG